MIRLGRPTHLVSPTSFRSTLCGIQPFTNVIVGRDANCIRCIKAMQTLSKKRPVPTQEQARAIWLASLRFVCRRGEPSLWTRVALQHELSLLLKEKQKEKREKDLARTRARRSNMTLEARRQEWREHQRSHRERKKNEEAAGKRCG